MNTQVSERRVPDVSKALGLTMMTKPLRSSVTSGTIPPKHSVTPQKASMRSITAVTADTWYKDTLTTCYHSHTIGTQWQHVTIVTLYGHTDSMLQQSHHTDTLIACDQWDVTDSDSLWPQTHYTDTLTACDKSYYTDTLTACDHRHVTDTLTACDHSHTIRTHWRHVWLSCNLELLNLVCSFYKL